MASIIKASINLSEIPKDKIYVGKKGKHDTVEARSRKEVLHESIFRKQREGTLKALVVALEKHNVHIRAKSP